VILGTWTLTAATVTAELRPAVLASSRAVSLSWSIPPTELPPGDLVAFVTRVRPAIIARAHRLMGAQARVTGLELAR
jgi:hypothetical protein